MTEMERGAAVRGGAEGAAESNLGDRLVAISREQGGERPNRGEWLEKEHKRLLEERGVESDSEPKSGSGKSSSQEKESVEEMREWWNSPKRMEEIREQVEYVANCWNKGEDGELAENKNEFYNSVGMKEICKLNLDPEWNKGEDGELAKNKNEFYNSVGLKEICKNDKKPSAYDKPHSSYDRTPTSSRSFSSAYERPSSSSRTPSAYDRPSSSRRAPSASDMSSSAQTSSRAPSSYDRPSLSSLGRSEETHSMMSSASSTGSVKTHTYAAYKAMKAAREQQKK